MSAVLRFGVLNDDGRRSAIYRVWCGRRSSDVYIAARSIGGELKASLHQTGQSHIALTAERVARRGPGASLEAGRYFEKWLRSPARASAVRAFSMYFPTTDLSAVLTDGKEKHVTWIPAAPADSAVAVEVFFVPRQLAAASWMTPEGVKMRVLHQQDLPNGETLCLVIRHVGFDPRVQQQLAETRERLRNEPELSLPADQWRRDTSTIRFILIGVNQEDGSRYFCDAALPPAA